jgi:hypothetical protein
VLSATEGNVTLRNNDTANGSIVIGQNTNITATSNGNVFGVVNLVIGPVPTSPEDGVQPSNVVVNAGLGGQVFYGANGITALAPDNTINVTGGNVVVNGNFVKRRRGDQLQFRRHQRFHNLQP